MSTLNWYSHQKYLNRNKLHAHTAGVFSRPRVVSVCQDGRSDVTRSELIALASALVMGRAYVACSSKCLVSKQITDMCVCVCTRSVKKLAH